jgi:DNA polymerase V
MDHNNAKKCSKDNKLQAIFGGDAQCGLFGITEDYLEDYLSLDELVIEDSEATFFLRAKGVSMAPLIQENDILVVDRSKTIKSNDIVILSIHGEMICKRLVKKAPHIFLYSENKHYKPILLTEEMEMVVFGKVSAILRVFA